MKIVIWGHPLHSHTHSYIHEAFFKTFKFLGFEVNWFHDNDFPSDFDYSNTLFITEGFADSYIPLNKTSTYVVMYPPNPRKYQDVKRFIELRLIAENFRDHISNYSFKKKLNEKVSEFFYLGKNISNEKENFQYDVVYTHWATNLLPNEFNFSDVYFPRKKIINFVGTISKNGINENYSNFKPFVAQAKARGIHFSHYNPWKNPVSSEKAKELVQESLVGVDIRGSLHLKQKLVTCRVFKNVSYGQFGLTNSYAIYEAMNGLIGFSENTAELLEVGLKNRYNYNLIKSAMTFCKQNHTYVNRCKDLMSVL